MTLKKRLKATASTLGRLTLGAVLGLGLAAAVISPVRAQVVTPPVADETPAIQTIPPAEGRGPRRAGWSGWRASRRRPAA